MWVNIKWYDAGNAVLREDGEYGVVTQLQGTPIKSLVNPDDPNSKVYAAHYGMTKEWADQLLALKYAPNLPLSFDRVTGLPDYTLFDLSQQPTGTTHETFHFALNNKVVSDNRIPTYGMSYDEASKRNALPVPATQYGNPTENGRYNHWDTLTLNPPANAVHAQIRLMYQPTSWEYVQFLYLSNKKQNAFLANEGDNLLSAWLATGQAEPHVMASATWGSPPAPTCMAPGAPQNLLAKPAKKAVTLTWSAGNPAPTPGGYRIYYSQAGKLQFRGGVSGSTLTYKDSGLTSRITYTYVVAAWKDCDSNGTFTSGVDLESPVSNTASATAQ